MRAFVFEPIRRENVEKLKGMGVNILPVPVPVPAWGYGNEPDNEDFSPVFPPAPEKIEEKKVETESELVERLENMIEDALPQTMPQTMPQLSHKEQIYKAICQLAMACDGASSKDGQGFNKTDAFFGHSLARQSLWSEKQYHYASKMLQKYRKQVGEIALYESH